LGGAICPNVVSRVVRQGAASPRTEVGVETRGCTLRRGSRVAPTRSPRGRGWPPSQQLSLALSLLQAGLEPDERTPACRKLSDAARRQGLTRVDHLCPSRRPRLERQIGQPPWRQPSGKSTFLVSTPLQTPSESGGICGRLTSNFPLGYLQGGFGAKTSPVSPVYETWVEGPDLGPPERRAPAAHIYICIYIYIHMFIYIHLHMYICR